MQDRRSLLSMFWAGCFPGLAFAGKGQVSVIKASDGPPLYVFKVDPEMVAQGAIIDDKSLQESWAKAWEGREKPPLMVTYGCDIYVADKQLCSIRKRLGEVEAEAVGRTPEEAKELWDFIAGPVEVVPSPREKQKLADAVASGSIVSPRDYFINVLGYSPEDADTILKMAKIRNGNA